MKKSLLPILSLCLVATPVLYGCDNHKSNNNGANNTASSSTSNSTKSDTPEYTPEQIEKFDVAGYKLGMSQAEAEAKLAREQWEGKFSALTSKEETSAYPFTQPNKELLLFRHQSTSGLKITNIELRQTYELEHDRNEIVAAIEKKYGKPTDTLDAPPILRFTWIPNDVRQHPHCGDTVRCTSQDYDEQKTEGLLPTLTVNIEGKNVRITLSSPRMTKADTDAVDAINDGQKRQQLKENSKAEKVQF